MQLADICEINPKAEVLDDNTLVSFVAMPGVSEEGRIKVDTLRTYCEVKKGFTSFKEGDVLFAKITPCMENGKGALAVGLRNGVGFGSTEFHVLRPDSAIVLGQWLYYLTSWPVFRKNAEKHMTGSAGQKRVPKSFLEKYEVAVPPIDNQRQQVLQLDRIRKIIELRHQQLSALDDLIKARFVEMFGYVKEERLLGDISEFVTVGIANSATHAYAESGIPMLRNQNIKENHLDDSDLIYIKPEFAAQYESKKLKENDIIAMRTGYPGIACLVPKKYEGCQTFTTLIVRLKAGNNPRYVCSYINSDLGKRYIDSGKVGVAQQNFGAKSLAKMPIKIAPKEMQNEYAEFVAQVDKSKSVIQKSLDETQLLFDSMMQQYFG